MQLVFQSIIAPNWRAREWSGRFSGANNPVSGLPLSKKIGPHLNELFIKSLDARHLLLRTTLVPSKHNHFYFPWHSREGLRTVFRFRLRPSLARKFLRAPVKRKKVFGVFTADACPIYRCVCQIRLWLVQFLRNATPCNLLLFPHLHRVGFEVVMWGSAWRWNGTMRLLVALATAPFQAMKVNHRIVTV